ncbi:MAG: fused MFS/spermidine synthase [Deltaproteobacteria bacterium]|jgi:spermidine synthase|nr:fused MFS/spermidine synthase [Deltaproteobacteria bacterium]
MTDESRPGPFSRIVQAFSQGLSPPAPLTVFEGDSPFTRITVKDCGNVRTLYMGKEAQESETSISLSDPSAAIFEYPGMMLLSLAVSPLNSDVTLIGLGGGFIPGLFQRFLPDRRLTVAEVDPLVAEIAETYFFFRPGGNVQVRIADGADHVESMPPGGADQIWLDAFTGDYIPPHMATDGFLELCLSRLKPGGLLVQNLHQTRLEPYRLQLRRTVKIFGGAPLVFAGRKSANSVVISSRHDGAAWVPPGAKAVTRMAKDFGPRVGPYDLSLESLKRVSEPDRWL